MAKQKEGKSAKFLKNTLRFEMNQKKETKSVNKLHEKIQKIY